MIVCFLLITLESWKYIFLVPCIHACSSGAATSELCLELGKELPRVPSGEFTMPHYQELHAQVYMDIAHTTRYSLTLSLAQLSKNWIQVTILVLKHNIK